MEASMTLEEAQQFRTKMWLTLGGMSGRAVLIGDLFHCEMFSGEVSDKLIGMLKHDNPKVERTALLVRGGAFAVQVERMVAEAARAASDSGKPAPPRRTFRDKLAARDWLQEVLSPDERARLHEFVKATF
jgi:hypothetical protein